MNTNDYKTNTNAIYTLRINSQIFECVKQSAKENKRSIAKQIEYDLEQIYGAKNETLRQTKTIRS